MEVNPDTLTVRFVPPGSALFSPTEHSYPEVADQADAQEFEDTLRAQTREACGQAVCGATVKTICNKSMFDERVRRHSGGDASWLQGVTIQCNTAECPLNGGSGGSGDREPRNPTPD